MERTGRAVAGYWTFDNRSMYWTYDEHDFGFHCPTSQSTVYWNTRVHIFARWKSLPRNPGSEQGAGRHKCFKFSFSFMLFSVKMSSKKANGQSDNHVVLLWSRLSRIMRESGVRENIFFVPGTHRIKSPLKQWNSDMWSFFFWLTNIEIKM